jgi:CheY-like chemotaxis protein
LSAPAVRLLNSLKINQSEPKRLPTAIHNSLVLSANSYIYDMKCRQLLYVDDDEDDQELFQMAVAEIDDGIECISAFDATTAWRKLMDSEWKPNLIFLDLNMPVIDGWEFLKRIRRRNDFNDIEVIVLSTSSNPSIIQSLKEMGARDFITKPGSYPELVNLLQSWLRP